MSDVKMLSRAQARRYYDRLGSLLDTQRVFEGRAIEALVERGMFDSARSVFEFGCGTGRLAARLLSRELPADGRYLGVDISPTMVRLARQRVQRWAQRAEIKCTDGSPPTSERTGAFDRFVSTYVLDLLSDADIDSVLAEANRLLAPGGLLCLASLTLGPRRASRLFSAVWMSLHALRPAIVGGCRPLRLRGRVTAAGFDVRDMHIVVAFGFPSEVIVARRAR